MYNLSGIWYVPSRFFVKTSMYNVSGTLTSNLYEFVGRGLLLLVDRLTLPHPSPRTAGIKYATSANPSVVHLFGLAVYLCWSTCFWCFLMRCALYATRCANIRVADPMQLRFYLSHYCLLQTVVVVRCR